MLCKCLLLVKNKTFYLLHILLALQINSKLIGAVRPNVTKPHPDLDQLLIKVRAGQWLYLHLRDQAILETKTSDHATRSSRLLDKLQTMLRDLAGY